MSRFPIDTAEIRILAEILAETGLTEIEVSDGESRVRVARTPATIAPMAAVSAPVATAPMPVPAPSPVQEVAVGDHPGAVKSPMVGVAYLSSEPGVAPFVLPGQAVVAGQTLLLIEAMKTFNQIKAPKAGAVRSIHVSSGQPVEYGELLVVIE